MCNALSCPIILCHIFIKDLIHGFPLLWWFFYSTFTYQKKKIKDLIHGTKHNAMLTPLTSMYPCY